MFNDHDFIDGDLLLENSSWINDHFSELCPSAVLDYGSMVCNYCNDIHKIDKKIKPCNSNDPDSVVISFEQICSNMDFLYRIHGSTFMQRAAKFAYDIDEFVKLNTVWENGGKFVVRI